MITKMTNLFKSIFRAMFILVVLSFLMAQIPSGSDFDRSKVLEGLEHPDWKQRAHALQSIPVTRLTDPEISEILINLLKSENDSYWTTIRMAVEDWAHYYWLLIRKVGETGNDKAIPVLVNSIYAGGGGNLLGKAIGRFGDKGIVALLDAFDRPNDAIVREDGTVRNEVVDEIIVLRYAMDYIAETGYVLSTRTQQRIIPKMIELTTDNSKVPLVRIDAVKILGKIDDPEVIAHLKYLAASDPYYVNYTIPGKRPKRIEGYPVRKEAERQLKKIRKLRQEDK